MNPTVHSRILQRAGIVLVVAGLLDIAVMVYCIVNRIPYASSLNVFAVVAGIFLLRGNLRAASLVRGLSVFLLTCFVALLIAWPFIQPIDLTLTEVRLEPLSAVATIGILGLVTAVLVWLNYQLSQAAVLEAHAASGRKKADMRVPIAAGIGLVVLVSISLALLLGGESASRAKSIAEGQLGANYRYHVSSLSIQKNASGTSIEATVTAWNKNEVRSVPVSWHER